MTSYALVPAATLKGHQETVWNASWNPTGSLLATYIRIWGMEGSSWVCKTVLTDTHSKTIRSISWSPCGNLLSSASFDGTVCVWDKRKGEFQCTSTLEGHENEVKSTAWSASGAFLATCSRDKSVWIWEVIDEGEEFECASVLHHHTQDVKCVRWHPTEELLASCGYDDTIKMYKEDADDWCDVVALVPAPHGTCACLRYCCASLEGHDSTVWSIAFDASGDRLASCSGDQTVKIWKAYKPGNPEGIPTPNKDAVWKCVCTLSGYHQRAVYDISWSCHSGLLATACGDDTIRIFKETFSQDSNQPNFSIVCEKKRAHNTDINCVAWNPKDPTLLASCSDDCTVCVWKCTEE